MWRRFGAKLAELDALEVVLWLSLACVVLYSNPAWYFRVPFGAVLTIVLIFRDSIRSEHLWFVICGLSVVALGLDWYALGNHDYLLFYWCLTVFLALLSSNPGGVLRVSGRLIIGAVFLLATGWKLSSAEYRSGTFFSYMLISDYRLAPFGVALTSLTSQDVKENQLKLPKGVVGPIGEGAIPLKSALAIKSLAFLLTWATVIVEGLVALAFLWPLGHGPSRYRDAILTAFFVSGYVIAPVASFGTVLAAMGMAQAPPNYRLLYLALFVGVQLMGLRFHLV